MRLKSLLFTLLLLSPFGLILATSQKTTLNVLAWGGEISPQSLERFEKHSGIKVNVITFDSNEAMAAKLKLSGGFDVVLSSSYFIKRLFSEDLISPLNANKIPNLALTPSFFLKEASENQMLINIPYVWGVTGIFFNKNFNESPIDSWNQLWQKKFENKLLILDDAREVFSMALMTLGFNPNDDNLVHINLAYEKLKELLPNIKLFGTNAIQASMIDEDVNQGMAWNGDAYKAKLENPHIQFVFPKEGFVIWIDCFALLKKSKQEKEAYQFINFMISDLSSQEAAKYTGYTPTNLNALKSLDKLQSNPIFNPNFNILKKGTFQKDLPQKARLLIEKRWQQLKI